MAVREEEFEVQAGPVEGLGAVVYAWRSPRPARLVARRRMLARRAGAAACALLVAGALGSAWGGPPGPTSPTRSHVPRTVVMQPGDSLWAVAERWAPAGQDPRLYVDALVSLNHLDGSPVAGERLRLPNGPR